MAISNELQTLIDGKQYVIDKINAKANSSLSMNSTWQELGDTVDNLALSGDTRPTVQQLINLDNSTYYLFYNRSSTTLDSILNNIDTSKVTIMYGMFYGCANLKAIPRLITSAATNLISMFSNCYNLERIELSDYKPASTTHTQSMFSNCRSLTTLILRNISTTHLYSNSFNNCYHLTGLADASYNPTGAKDCYIYVPSNKVATLKSATNWSIFADQIKSIYSVCSYGNGTYTQSNSNSETILQASPQEGATFTGWYNGYVTENFNVSNVVETTFETLNIDYPFTLNNNGYYQNSNQNKDSTYSIGRFRFTITNPQDRLRITYKQTGESNYDFGIIGNVDVATSQSTATTGYLNLSNTTNLAQIFIDDISVGDHFIDIKYKKDGGGTTSPDTLEVKVEVVQGTSTSTINGTLYSTESEINIGVVDEQTMEPLNLIAVFESA